MRSTWVHDHVTRQHQKKMCETKRKTFPDKVDSFIMNVQIEKMKGKSKGDVREEEKSGTYKQKSFWWKIEIRKLRKFPIIWFQRKILHQKVINCTILSHYFESK